jgi:hypothetical protein
MSVRFQTLRLKNNAELRSRHEARGVMTLFALFFIVSAPTPSPLPRSSQIGVV